MSVAMRSEVMEQQNATDRQIATFLGELTALSAKHGIGITGAPVLFMVEPQDRQFEYRIDDESNLSLG